MATTSDNAELLLSKEIYEELAQSTLQIRESLIRTKADWLPLADFAALFGLREETLSRWEIDHKVFSVDFEGVRYYPVFAIDQLGKHPFASLHQVIKLFLGEAREPWDIAYWMCSANGYLGSQRPADLLHADSQSIIEAAGYELQGILHG